MNTDILYSIYIFIYTNKESIYKIYLYIINIKRERVRKRERGKSRRKKLVALSSNDAGASMEFFATNFFFFLSFKNI